MNQISNKKVIFYNDNHIYIKKQSQYLGLKKDQHRYHWNM